jgi:hypothetical protein
MANKVTDASENRYWACLRNSRQFCKVANFLTIFFTCGFGINAAIIYMVEMVVAMQILSSSLSQAFAKKFQLVLVGLASLIYPGHYLRNPEGGRGKV